MRARFGRLAAAIIRRDQENGGVCDIRLIARLILNGMEMFDRNDFCRNVELNNNVDIEFGIDRIVRIVDWAEARRRAVV